MRAAGNGFARNWIAAGSGIPWKLQVCGGYTQPMIRHLVAAGSCVLWMSAPANAQQMDMDAMQKWMASKNVSWHIVGKFEGDASISSDGQGMAHVTDVVEVDVTIAWQNDNSIVGVPKIKNAASVVTNLHDREPKCLAPTLKGTFDYVTLDAVTPGMAGGLHFKMTRTFPEAVVSQVCSSTKVAPAKKVIDEDEMMIMPPTMLAMGMSDKNMAISPDKKSLILKSPAGFDGWVWTLTPTPAP
jgi:hypothetical protein